MKNLTLRTLTLFLVVLAAIQLLPRQTVSASGDINFLFNKETRTLTGSLSTSERITRLEIYVTDGYNYNQFGNICLQESLSGITFYLRGATVSSDASEAGTTDIVYGGSVPVPEYEMQCLIYYIVSENIVPLTWNMNVYMETSLKEIFVAKSVVPSNWQTSSSVPVVTIPTEFCLGFINSAASAYSSSDIKTILQYNAVEVEEGTFSGELILEEEADPLKTLLIVLIAFTIVAIIVTAVLIKKEKAKNEKMRSEAFVNKANAKVRAKKRMENDELNELIGSYNDDYNDDDMVSTNINQSSVSEEVYPTQPTEPLSLEQNPVQPVPQPLMMPLLIKEYGHTVWQNNQPHEEQVHAESAIYGQIPTPEYQQQTPPVTYIQQPVQKVPQFAKGSAMKSTDYQTVPEGQQKIPAFARKK